MHQGHSFGLGEKALVALRLPRDKGWHVPIPSASENLDPSRIAIQVVLDVGTDNPQLRDDPLYRTGSASRRN